MFRIMTVNDSDSSLIRDMQVSIKQTLLDTDSVISVAAQNSDWAAKAGQVLVKILKQLVYGEFFASVALKTAAPQLTSLTHLHPQIYKGTLT